MSSNKNIEYVLNQFAVDIKAKPPEFNAESRCQIIIGDVSLFLEAPPYDNNYIISSVVFEGIPTEAILEEALSGNFYWLETHGGTLMWDRKTQKLLLSYRGNSEIIDLMTFKNIIKNFVYTSRFWTFHLKNTEIYEKSKIVPNKEMREKILKGEKV